MERLANLFGGTSNRSHPIEKDAAQVQIGSSSADRGEIKIKIKKVWNHHLEKPTLKFTEKDSLVERTKDRTISFGGIGATHSLSTFFLKGV